MNAIKESFDNLPTAACFFDRKGLVCLMNRRMLDVGAALLGSGIQTLAELHAALAEPPETVAVVDAAMGVYQFPDGGMLRFEEKEILDRYGRPFTQVTAADVTELVALQGKLKEENARLADANRRAKRLYDRMPEIVREEEILAMKMRVHDDIGHTILSARRALRQGESVEAVRASAAAWEKSIALLCHANQLPETQEPLEYAKARAAALGAEVVLEGTLPECACVRALFALAIRECTSNCVRHAHGNQVYAVAKTEGGFCTLTITNNGQPPKDAITEGGGLSSLRRRMEQAGGWMTIESQPRFVLTVTLPDEEEKR